MTLTHACPICAAPAEPMMLPVSVRRAGRTVFRLEVPAWHCSECGYVDVEDATRESVIATLEEHTRPGDDIVFALEEA
ncbi:hypothetical protein [Benzoatithermus flavus]|uniref:YgiT-type zinc finger domain-containing protein n=1 Tax=Benzoatithermus flavus TaxID=3108223 RepID=A0ABU8XN70_9PROT